MLKIMTVQTLTSHEKTNCLGTNGKLDETRCRVEKSKFGLSGF